MAEVLSEMRLKKSPKLNVRIFLASNVDKKGHLNDSIIRNLTGYG